MEIITCLRGPFPDTNSSDVSVDRCADAIDFNDESKRRYEYRSCSMYLGTPDNSSERIEAEITFESQHNRRLLGNINTSGKRAVERRLHRGKSEIPSLLPRRPRVKR